MTIVSVLGRRALRLIPVVLLLAITTACQTSETDRSGKAISLTEPKEIMPWESRFNTFALLNQNTVFRADRITRDNGIGIIENVNSEDLSLIVEHFSDAWISDQSIRDLKDSEDFNTAFRSVERGFTPRPLGGGGAGPVGYFADNGRCSAAQFGKRLSGPTTYRNDRGAPDTIVRVISCGEAKLDMERFAKDFDLSDRATRSAIQSAVGRLYGT